MYSLTLEITKRKSEYEMENSTIGNRYSYA